MKLTSFLWRSSPTYLINDWVWSGLPNLYAVRPFSENAKSKSSRTEIRIPQLESFDLCQSDDGQLTLTIISCDSELLCDLDEI
jgi:hypothetical protein